MDELMVESQDSQSNIRFLDEGYKEFNSGDDKLCFNMIFTNQLPFGITLIILSGLFLILFIMLIVFWNQRKFWYPMQERSTYCTLAFLICCAINFFIQPFLLIIYNSSDAVYTVDGDLEKAFKFFYIFSRFSLTTLYIAKVSRLSFAFSVKEINIFYKFFKRENLVLLTALFISAAVSFALIFTESQNIVLSIERGYAGNVQQFWVPVQCIEAMVYSTLFLMMQNVAPYYKVSLEIASTFISNLILSIIQYSLYADNRDAPNYCHLDTDAKTYIIFSITQVRTLLNVIFCVFIPLLKAYPKNIPLPHEKVLINTINGMYAINQFFVWFTMFNRELRPPFVKFLKYMDEQIEKRNVEGEQLLHRIEVLSQKYPMIKLVHSYSVLFSCYEDVSFAVEQGDQNKMEEVVSQYIYQPDIQLDTIIQNDHSRNNHTNQFSPSTFSSNLMTVNNQDQTNNTYSNNPMLQRLNSKHKLPTWKKCLPCFFKNKDKIKKRDNFQLDDRTYQKVMESFFHVQDNHQSLDQSININKSEQQKEALQNVQQELFQHIHILWQEFFSRTRSFEYLREVFQRYGEVRNHLQQFNLSNEKYESEESSTPQRSFDQ